MRAFAICGTAAVTIMVSACAIQPNDPFAFYPEVTIPDDGNHYIVPRTSNDIYLRPHLLSPEIGRIFSTSSSPKVVRVYSKLKNSWGNRDWWEVRHQGQRGYIMTSGSPSLEPYIGTDLPSSRDILGGYEDKTLLITGVSPSLPNSASGVDARIGIINPSAGATIKYVRYEISPYNRVGDRVRGTIKKSDRARLRSTGPIEGNGLESWANWKNVFYNNSIICMELNSVEITYMDDSSDHFTGNDLASILHSDTNNDCSYIE